MRRRFTRIPLLVALLVPVLVAMPTGPGPGASAAPLRPATLVPAAVVPAAVVPGGFTDTAVATVPDPTTVVGLPDGRVVVLSHGGTVRIISGGVLQPAPALTLDVCSNSERGLLGFAVDPAFGVNLQVYVYFTRPAADAPGGCVNRVSRFTMVGGTIDPVSEVVLLDRISSVAGNHNGGDLEIGNDGYLYVAVGDAGCNPRSPTQCSGANTAAQDLSLLNGKILRVDRFTGRAAPGNPLNSVGFAVDCRVRGNLPSTPGSWCREIFAWGLRNPWRFAFDPNTGATRFRINDVGQGAREEVNEGIAGANYGWPAREGVCRQGAAPPCPGPATDPDPATAATCRGSGPNACIDPIADYGHDDPDGGSYITGGAYVPDGAWPPAFDGAYLFADGNPGRILVRTAAGAVSVFASDVGGIADLGFVIEPGGWALYYVQAGGSSNVRRIRAVTAPATSPGPLAYVPLGVPQRAFDSRDRGADSGPLRAGTSRLVHVAAPSPGLEAALVNITMVQPLAGGFVTSWEPRTTRTLSANVNAPPGRTVGNAAILRVDANGDMVVFANVTAHVVVDVLGTFSVAVGAVGAGRLQALTPVRAVDTREPPGPTNPYTRTPAPTETVVNVPLVGAYGIENTAAAAVLVVTAISGPSAGPGHVVVGAHGGAVPLTASVNVAGGGDRRGNLVVVPIGADGSVDVRLRKVTDVVVDVVGTFTGGSVLPDTDGLYVPIVPTREVDSRTPLGFPRLAARSTGTHVAASVPASPAVLAQNVTIVATGSAGYLTAHPDILPPRPLVSNQNATAAGQTRAAFALTPTGVGGSVAYYAHMPTDLVVDVFGWFIP